MLEEKKKKKLVSIVQFEKKYVLNILDIGSTDLSAEKLGEINRATAETDPRSAK